MNIQSLKSKLTIKNKFYILLVWILFTSVEPFQFYAIVPFHPYKILVFLVASLFFFILLSKGNKLIFDIPACIIILHVFYSLLAIPIHLAFLDDFSPDDGVIYINLFLQLIVIFITYIFITQILSIHVIAVTLIKVMAVMAFLGMVSLFLIYFFNFQPFSYTVRPGVRDISNFITTFATGVHDNNFASIVRSAGYFDEPGTFAYFLTVALLLNKLYGYSKAIEKILVFFGFCTLSLAFMVTLFLYFIIFGIIEKKYLFIMIFFGVISILTQLIYIYKEKNEFGKQVYELTMYRLQSDDTGDKLFNGDNRSENLSYAYKAFLKAPLFGHGMNAHVNIKNEFYGKLCCNPLHPIATDGIIGTLIFFLLFIVWGLYIFKGGNVDLISAGAWFIILISLIQRPGFLAGPFGYFVFIFLFQATKWRKEKLPTVDIYKFNKLEIK